jgi:ureidoglycolate hydrolase
MRKKITKLLIFSFILLLFIGCGTKDATKRYMKLAEYEYRGDKQVAIIDINKNEIIFVNLESKEIEIKPIK